MAEAWDVWHVLRLAWDCGIRKAILALDNLLVVTLISNGSSSINMTSSLVQDIRRMLNWDWEIQIQHTFREGKRVADAMANMGFQLPIGEHRFDQIPRGVTDIIRQDLVGVSCPRMCNY